MTAIIQSDFIFYIPKGPGDFIYYIRTFKNESFPNVICIYVVLQTASNLSLGLVNKKSQVEKSLN